jgi:CO/xanthine dehydrogenase FAD-binding subunit
VIDPALQKAIKHQENYNRRQVATLGGNMVSGSGRSPVLGMMLALDAELELVAYQGEPQQLRLGDFLPLRQESLLGRVITSIRIPAEVKTAYEYVARSPADLPIVGACVVQWPSGRTRVVLLGYGDQPVMIFDGPEAAGADIAARDAYQEAGDQWASADYRSDASAVLVKRCLGTIANRKEE